METFVVLLCAGMMRCATVRATTEKPPVVKTPDPTQYELRYERWVNGRCQGALQWNSYSQRYQTILGNDSGVCPSMWKGSVASEAREFGTTEY